MLHLISVIETPLEQLITSSVPVFFLSVLGFIVAMLITPIYTYFAYKYKAWKRPRDTAVTGEKLKIFSKLHEEKHKRNIPTMAGIIVIVAVAIVTLIFNFDFNTESASFRQVVLPLLALLGAGVVGLADDFINIRGLNKGVAGLRSQVKLFLIVGVASLGAWYMHFKLGYDAINVPWLGSVDIGWLIIPLFVLVVVSTANAVNISDGLDGLAGGLLASAFAAYAMIAFLQGHIHIAGFCMTMLGALLAYTWFNIYPARFFMGDVGSFAFGTALGVVAMLTDTVLLLPIIGAVFVMEAGSSLVQILSKKIRNGKKIFISAPIHHHFEAKGWPETKVTMRFWILGQIAAFLGIMLGAAGGML